MDKEQQGIIHAYDAVRNGIAALGVNDRLVLLATIAGEDIATDPERNRRRAFLKLHDEMVRSTVKSITGAK